MIYKQKLESIISDIERTRNSLVKELASLPDGNLNAEKYGETEYYRRRLPKKGNRKKVARKTITKETGLVALLVRKKYVEKAIKTADKDLEILQTTLKRYRPFDENSLMAEYVHEHPLLADCIYNNTDDSSEWASNYERQKDFYDDDLTSLSGDKTPMRSRGEIVIAEKLRQYSIPFRYECGIGIPDIPYVPDFTIRRPRDGKIFYWEHIGDVNDMKYMNRNKRKFEVYEEYGIVPWDNLIITYDLGNGGVNVPLIEGMIQAWLL